MRLLFCLPTTALSGGVKVVFEIANRLTDAGETAHLFSFAASPRWCTLRAPLVPARDLERAGLPSYDFVLVSNAFFLPSVLPLAGSARVVFFCQDYEAFHHAVGARYEDFMAESETMAALYRLPVPIIATSQAVQGLIRERLGKDALYVPIGIDKTVFCARPPHALALPARVLMVGNYLMPYKGMTDGLEALRRLAPEIPVQLVLVTQEKRGRHFFADVPFPVELHYCPTDREMADIMATCDVYCCTSWYEGLGLPALEAFACGLPVVSTRTYGVSDYGIDGRNLLLAQPNDPADLQAKLTALLRDPELRNRLRRGGFATIRGTYDWEVSTQRFREALANIDRTYTGAGLIDGAAMRTLLSDLEAEGGLTPIHVFREFQALSAELDGILRTIAEGDLCADHWSEPLGVLRDRFAGRLANPRAQYYDAYKSKYDLCRLVTALADQETLRAVVNGVLNPKQGHDDRVAAGSFSEIRYRE